MGSMGFSPFRHSHHLQPGESLSFLGELTPQLLATICLPKGLNQTNSLQEGTTFL